MNRYIIKAHNNKKYVLFGEDIKDTIYTNLHYIKRIMKRCYIKNYMIKQISDNEYNLIIYYFEINGTNNKLPKTFSVIWDITEQIDKGY